MKKIGDLLFSVFGSNLGTKLISVIIAGVLWSVVLGSRTVEVTKEIPLEVITSPDIVPSNELPEKVSFRISGPKAFLRAILDRPEDPVRVNLVGAEPGVITHRFFSDNLRVPIGVKVMGINPPAIVIRLEPRKKKEIPIRAELRGTPPPGFHIQRVEVVPPVLRLQGAHSRLEGLNEIPTLPIDVSSLIETYDKEAVLDLARLGVAADSAIPHVKIYVSAEERTVRFRNVAVRVFGDGVWTVDPPMVTILARGPAQRLSNVGREGVTASVRLTGMTQPSGEAPVAVELPPEFHLIRVLPNRVKVSRK